MGKLFGLKQNPDGQSVLRYDGILAGAFGQLMCIGCPKSLYEGAYPTPAFPPEELKSGTQPQREDV